MKSVASAPAKIILFGEHSVVYGEPAIAAAVNKRVRVTIKESEKNHTVVKSKDLAFEADLDTERGVYHIKKGQPGIIRYILASLMRNHDHSPLSINVSMEMPIGAGLGSSAAITVATLAAVYSYNGFGFDKAYLAKKAYEIENTVQGSASPLDTSVSTYGDLVYLSRDKEVINFKSKLEGSFVIGYTSKRGNTGKMVNQVRMLKEKHPLVVDPIIISMGNLVQEAKSAITNGSKFKVAQLMNINHGLLDALGVNTQELSRMVYVSRRAGALGSKITGAGGGGSMIAFCPGKVNPVYKVLDKYEKAIKAEFSKEGVLLEQ